MIVRSPLQNGSETLEAARKHDEFKPPKCSRRLFEHRLNGTGGEWTSGELLGRELPGRELWNGIRLNGVVMKSVISG